MGFHEPDKDENTPLIQTDEVSPKRLRQYQMLVELGQLIVSEIKMDTLFEVIAEQTRRFMDTQGCSVFLFDEEKDQLWSRVSTDLKKDEIRFPADHGITGWVFQHGQPLLINDVHADPRFYPEVDRKTGFATRNILCVPLINRHKKCIGTFQILNKKSGSFDVEDQEQLKSVANYVTIALENAKLYEDLKLLDKAKERVINHLAHELKTPLAIASGVLEKVTRETRTVPGLHLEETLKRGTRQLQRLFDLQNKIDDILNQRPVAEQQRILDIIQNSADLVESFKDQGPANQAEIMKGIADRIASLFSTDPIQPEWLPLAPLLEDLLQAARSAKGARELEFILNTEALDQIHMDRGIVEKVMGGIIRNAIEHTPDEGRIVIGSNKASDGIRVWVRDHGVGITPANKAFIFSGFFHTMDTDLYSSKRPYAFNAGGAGADLLRTQVFSERFGFSVDFESRRCVFIPEDTDVCPGRISKCRFITDREGCLSSGGSEFSVHFPDDLSRFS